MEYKNYILDLGGVIINLSYQKTIDAFMALGCENFDDLYSQASQTDLFSAYETGKLSTQAFVNRLKSYLPQSITPNEIVQAWNAMILDFPVRKLEAIKNLKAKSKVFLLSNTNEIHMQKVMRTYRATNFKTDFYDLFHKVYLSHEIGMRKPNKDIFEYVCREEDLKPEETLFIDDTEQHIHGAQKVGLNTLHLKEEMNLLDFI